MPHVFSGANREQWFLTFGFARNRGNSEGLALNQLLLKESSFSPEPTSYWGKEGEKMFTTEMWIMDPCRSSSVSSWTSLRVMGFCMNSLSPPPIVPQMQDVIDLLMGTSHSVGVTSSFLNVSGCCQGILSEPRPSSRLSTNSVARGSYCSFSLL